MEPTGLLKIFDESGRFLGVFVDARLWSELEPSISRRISREGAPAQKNLDEFAAFLNLWNFSYPYDYAVECPHCSCATKDWLRDPEQHFVLHNASIGGLLVFHCRGCGATIRHKYFKDHMAVEVTPPQA